MSGSLIVLSEWLWSDQVNNREKIYSNYVQ
jgi:hypothetical protein